MADEVVHLRKARAESDSGPDEKKCKDSEKAKADQWSLTNWKIFLNERAPPVVFVLLALGPTLSGLKLFEGFIDPAKFFWIGFGLWLLLLTVRVMDDVKDYDKDVIIHPERPLPRGLISVNEVSMAIKMSLGFLLLYAVVLGLIYGTQAGAFFAFVVVYATLMYVEFGIGAWLDEHVILYAITHQVIIYFCGMLICTVVGENWYSSKSFLFGNIGLSGFFTYEVCRKLDPTLPLLKGTYLVVYGKWKTFAIVACAVGFGLVSAYPLNLHRVLWPMEIVMLVILLILFLLPEHTDKETKPKAHKPVEAFSVLYLLVHLWAGFFVELYRDYT